MGPISVPGAVGAETHRAKWQVVMEVEIRLFATLRLGRFKKRTMDLPQGARLLDVLQEANVPDEEVSLPLVNGRYSKLDRRLVEGDVVSIFPAVGGG